MIDFDVKITDEDNAILYRTNIESMSIIDVFTKRRIPFTLIDREYNFFEHFICKDIISYLKLSVNDFDKESFFRIINKPFRYVSKANLGYVRTYSKEEALFDILINKDDTPHLNKISLSSAISYIIMDLGYIDHIREYAKKINQSFEDFEDIIEEFKLSAEGYKTIFEFLAHIEEVKQSIDESKKKKDREGVILSTIHGVKGMEFKNVYIINACEDTMPHQSSKEENLEEERRLFYVGITRAIDNLYLFSPRNRKGQFKDISRFIVEGGFNKLPPDTYGYKVGSEIIHKAYGKGKILELDGDKAKIKFSDNIDRSFSLKVLVDNNLVGKTG
jgi:DNA helicase-2/ATP-dependent DNA helicase PcrA